MDATYHPPYPGVSPAETLPIREVQPVMVMTVPEASQRVYEQGSIAETIQRMFHEMDQNPAAYAQTEQEYAWDVHPHNPEAYQDVMRNIQDRVKNSDAVRDLVRKVDQQQEISAHDVEAVWRAYEQAFRTAVNAMKSEMSAKQMNVLKFQAHSELDYSFRDVITRHLIAGSEQEMHVDPLDFFLLLNPKARKIDYMSNKEILATLRHSMSVPTMSADRLKNDLRAVEWISHRADHKELMASDQVRKIQLDTRPKNS